MRAGLALSLTLVVATHAAAQAPRTPRPAPLPPPNPAAATLPNTVGGGGGSPLPPLTDDAQRYVDQWKQDLASIIESMRFLQQTYRDNGRAEDAAAVAAQIRQWQQPGRTGQMGATAELVHEGLPNRDAPVLMSLFRDRVGETLSFAIRGRDDQVVWGTTTYTDDSALETAAVHAGLVRPGQAAIIKVTIAPGLNRYEASEKNGIQSSAFTQHPGSFRFVSASIARPQRTPSLSSYRDLVGQTLIVPVVGDMSTNLWGTDVYTDDSSLGAAAVHAGVLSVGEFGMVKVTLMPGQDRYDASPRNGVVSKPFETFAGSFRIERAADGAVVELPGGEDASGLVDFGKLRTHVGASVVVKVVGSATGPVWGTDTYTDDSSIAAAAVHAGLLRVGETGVVRVTVARGRESYPAVERHGIKSQPYGKWDGSLRLERAAQ